ncbi:MAG: GTP cyclohydrolase II, partial [Rhodobacteraceae bacterium]|nr:GTP cyclohydrolase II [Paracoccaceae bacterium]
MTLGPSIAECLNRARADLRMGVPVVLSLGPEAILFAAAETLEAARFSAFGALGPVTMAITGRRAETLKARAYDGDIARLVVPPDATPEWVRAVADPADDLRAPMKGPLRSIRDGDATLYRAAIQLAKSARLLPAVLSVALANPAAVARTEGLTLIEWDRAGPEMAAATGLAPVVSARLPMAAAEAGRLHVFRPDDGGEE